jgi:hypothetical protein
MALDEPVGITKYFHKKERSETPPPKRAPSPPHEYVLADNPDIAVSCILAVTLYKLDIAFFAFFGAVRGCAANASQFLVHRHVPRAFSRSIPAINTTLWTTGH